MAEDHLHQNTFDVGEIGPKLQGRFDLAAYRAALAQLQNFTILRTGGLVRRQGSRFVAEVPDSGRRVRLIPFRASRSDSYILELGHRTLRVYVNEGLQLLQPYTFSASAVEPISDQITIPGHGYLNTSGPFRLTTTGTLPAGLLPDTDYYVRRPSTVGWIGTDVDTVGNKIDVTNDLTKDMGPYRLVANNANPANPLSERTYYIFSSAGTSFQLTNLPTPDAALITLSTQDEPTMLIPDAFADNKLRLSETRTGAIIDIIDTGEGFHTITPQTPVAPFVLNTPWDSDELAVLQYAQSVDVMYFRHPDHPLMKLTRMSVGGWKLETPDLEDGPYGGRSFLEADAALTTRNVTVASVNVATVGTNRLLSITDEDTGDGVPVLNQAYDLGRLVTLARAEQRGWGRIRENSSIYFRPADIRFTEADLLANTNYTTSVITQTAHGFDDQEGPVQIWNEDKALNLPSPLKEKRHYWIIKIDNDNFQLAASASDASTGTFIALTDPGSVTANSRVISSYIDKDLTFDEGEGPIRLYTYGSPLPGVTDFRIYYAKVVTASTTYQLLDGIDGDPVVFDEVLPGTEVIWCYSGATNQSSINLDILEAITDVNDHTNYSISGWSPDPRIGFPASVAFHEQRLLFGGSVGYPQTVWGSMVGDFEKFSPDTQDLDAPTAIPPTITDANAYLYTLVSRSLNQLNWMIAGNRLTIGSLDAVWGLQATSLLEAITPTNVNARPMSGEGSAQTLPEAIGDEIVYLDSTHSRLIAAGFQSDRETITANDISLLARHLFDGFKADEMAYAASPDSLLWIARSDGTLLSLTYDRLQKVAGWARHVLGGDGAVESVAVIPHRHGPSDPGFDHDPDDDYDQLWMVVRRTVEGETRRYVEFLTPHFDPQTPIEEAQFLDSSPVPYSGALSGTFGGLSHLVGETVMALADGATYRDLVVDASGEITLPNGITATQCQVGYPIVSYFETLPPETGGKSRLTARGLTQRAVRAYLQLDRSMGGQIGTDLTQLKRLVYRTPYDPMAKPPPLSSDLIEIAPNWQHSRGLGLFIYTDDPLPFSVPILTQRISVSDR